jgi:hypothetical protein
MPTNPIYRADRNMKLLACLICVFFGYLSAAARGEIVPAEVARGAYPDLAVDAAGNLHLVYVRAGKLWYRQRPQAAHDWTAEQDTGLGEGRVPRSDPEVVTDSHNRPHVMVGGGYAWFNGTRWQPVKIDVVRDTAMAIDAQDNVYVVRRGGHQGGHIGLLVRRAGTSSFEASAFEPLPDPDIASGLPLGRNDHVYGHLAIDPADSSLHIVYRHGSPKPCAYRTSSDGGRTWSGGGICDDDRESPSVCIGRDRGVYMVSGTGQVFCRTKDPDQWQPLGRAVPAGGRDLPVMVADAHGRLYVGAFGGRFSVYSNGQWGSPKTLPALSNESLGFVDLAASPGGERVYAVWEQGSKVHNDEPAGESAILFARLDEHGSAAPRQVGQWDRFEASVVNRKNYADPYRDVTLNVVYTRPDKSSVKFWGFYDGEGAWKLRCMPDQIGDWTYEATFSDRSPGAKGSFRCEASQLPGMISRDETNPIWFGYRGGKHALVRALHVGDRLFAENWPASERKQFLDWTGKQGYNTLSIASHFLNRNEPGRGRGWQTPALWPLNSAEYRKMELILDDLASRGIIVFPFAGFFGQNSNYPSEPADQELYIHYTLARLGCYWNLMWNTAGPEPNVARRWMSDADVQRLGRLIARLDPYGHLISVHNRTGDDPYRDADWTTYGILQGPKTNDLKRLSAGLLESHHREKPLLAQETLWSGNVNHIRALGGRDYTDEELRKNAWVIHMSAAALVFADNAGGNSSAGFSGSLNPAEAEQNRHDIVKRVWDVAEQFPFYRLKPRQDLVDAGYCLAEPGSQYLIYLPEASAVNVKVEGGSYRAEWISARGGAKRQAGGQTQDGAGLNPPGDGDWLLWLTRETK